MKSTFPKTVLVALGLGLLYVSCVPQSGGDDSVLVGKPAQDFSLQMIDDHPVKPSDFKGRVLVMDFWATWCPPCRQSLPNLNRLSNDPSLARRGLKVLAVNSQEAAGQVKEFMDGNHYTFPVALDTGGSAEHLYQVTGLPTTVIIGRDGKVANVFVGFDPGNTESEISTAIDKALSE